MNHDSEWLREIASGPSWDDIPADHRSKLHDIADRIEAMNADLAAAEAKLAQAVGHLDVCLDWMEQLRACGDCGNWDWSETDDYTKARDFLATIQPEGETDDKA